MLLELQKNRTEETNHKNIQLYIRAMTGTLFLETCRFFGRSAKYRLELKALNLSCKDAMDACQKVQEVKKCLVSAAEDQIFAEYKLIKKFNEQSTVDSSYLVPIVISVTAAALPRMFNPPSYRNSPRLHQLYRLTLGAADAAVIVCSIRAMQNNITMGMPALVVATILITPRAVKQIFVTLKTKTASLFGRVLGRV